MTLTLPPMASASHTLHILRYLKHRMTFTFEQKVNYDYLIKGHKGEKKLNQLIEDNLSTHYLMINDLRLNHNGTEFQIDTLLISDQTLFLLEVKNFSGDYYLKNNNWYSATTHNEVRNPLHQLKRSKILLKNFLNETTFKFSVKPYLIFINPHFYLYSAPLNLPIIFAHQITQFINKLNSNPFKQTTNQINIKKHLTIHHVKQSSYEKLPSYNYETLKKGIICASCSRFAQFNGKQITCSKCHHVEKLEKAINRHIIEFHTLFPNKKITTNVIYEWCAIIKSKKTIRNTLKKNMIKHGTGRHTYYTFKNIEPS